MAEVYKFEVELGGFAGAPGLNSWFFGSPAGPIDVTTMGEIEVALVALYENFRTYMASGVTYTLAPAAKVFDAESGDLVGAHPLEGFSASATGSNGDASRASQVKLQLITGAVVNNRFVRGGCYMGPINSNATENDGTIESDVKMGLQTAVTNLILAGPLVVWHRPKNGAGGQLCEVLSVSVMDVPAVLRSRRD